MVKEHPIIFSTDMVKALLEGRKTQTRRILNPQPYSKVSGIKLTDYEISHFTLENHPGWVKYGLNKNLKCRFGKPGDLLWVRETWKKNVIPMGWPYHYYEDDSVFTNKDNEKWKPSIHMPKEAARIWLEVKDIRIERLNEISEADAFAEGIEVTSHYKNAVACNPKRPFNAITGYMYLWEAINGFDSWNSNPWIWAITFKVLSTTGHHQLLSENYGNKPSKIM